MGLFGSGVLRKQIDELAVQLESMRRELETIKSERSDLKKELSAQEALVRSAKESRKKVEKKLERVTAARTSADQKAASHQDQIGYLEKELATYRQELKTVRSDLEKTRAELVKAGQAVPEPVVVEEPTPRAAEAPQEVRVDVPRPPRNDRRVERLEEQLAQEKSQKQNLKDRVNRAEKLGRDAERRRVSDLNRAEAVLRDLRHSLRSERRAYKVLQLQFEAMRTRAIDGLPYEEPSVPPMAVVPEEPSTPPVVVDVRDSIKDDHEDEQAAQVETEQEAVEAPSTTAPEVEAASSSDSSEDAVEESTPEAEATAESTNESVESEIGSSEDPIRPRRRVIDSEG